MRRESYMDLPPFVSQLTSDPVEMRKLESLGAGSPQALLGMIIANRDAFDRFVGHDEAERIVQRLRTMVPPGSVSVDPAPPGKLGVPLTSGPAAPAAPRFDINRRDAMFSRLEQLRRLGAPAEEIRRAEQELDTFLSGSNAGVSNQH
jgi:hypothetical protein